MAAKERICFCCKTHYKYCPSCKGYDPNETWKFLVHDENCLAVYDIWQAYRSKKMNKDDAAKALSALKIDYIIKSDSPVVPEIKEILGIVDEPEEVVVEEDKSEDIVENKNQQINPRHKYNNKKK
jgi:hypothetical protein